MSDRSNRLIFPGLFLTLLLFIGVGFFFHNVRAISGINKEISYYGVLNSASGTSVADGNFDMVFKIYNDKGTVLWTGTYTTQNGNPVTVKAGNFEVILGSGDGNDLTIDFSQDEYYLGLTVGQDSEMIPRQRLGASPYAFNADSVNGTSIYKVNKNPNKLQKGSVGDIALDIANTKIYVKVSGDDTDTGWATPIQVPEADVLTMRSLTDVKITNLASNDVLSYNGLGKWVNKTTGNITSLTSGVTISGGSRAALGSGVTISIVNSDSTHTGLLTAADYKTFTAKENVLTFSGPLSRNSNAVALNQASGSADGYLSTADWNTFGAKENALTFSGPVSRNGNAVSLNQASGSASGYLSSTDWNTFNNKGSSQWTTSGLDVTYSGDVGIGKTDPSARLHLGAGSATAGSAPLKIDAGTLLASAETGAIEFDGASLYYTDNEATPVRHRIAKDEMYFNTPITTGDTVTYQHPRDPSEINGNTNYSNAIFNTYGMYEQMPSNTSVSAIIADVWCTNTNRDVTIKLFVRDGVTPFNPDVVSPLYTGTIGHASMPHATTSGGATFTLTSTVNVQAGQYLFVLWETTVGGELHIANFNEEASSAPLRHSFIIGTDNENFSLTSTDTFTKFFGATFRVLATTDITRTSTEVLGAELFGNTDMETPGTMTGIDYWASWDEVLMSGGSIADETTLVHGGSHAIKMTSSGVNWYSPQVQQAINVTAGTEYQLSFWSRGDGTYPAKYAILDLTHVSYINNSNNSLSAGNATTTYTEFTTTFIAPAGCTRVIIYLAPDNTGAGHVAYFDDLTLRPFETIATLQPLSIQTILNNLPSAAITFSDPDGIMTSTNVRDAILEAYNHAASPTIVSPRIVLPDTLYAVVDDNLQLFVRGMIEAQDPYNLPYVLNSTIGSSYPRYYEHTPVVGDVGNKSFTAKVLNYDYSVLTTKTVALKVVNPAGQPTANKNILCLGDSLTVGGVWPTELYRRLTKSGGTPVGLNYSNITFIGDKAMSSYPTQGYTGFGGWTYGDYNGSSNATSGHVLTGTFDKDKTDVASTWSDSNGNRWMIVYATGGLKVYGPVNSPVIAPGTLPASGTLTHYSGASHLADIVYTSATTEPATPLWDSGADELSFTNWFTRNGFSGTVDAVYVLLGWNGRSSNQTDYTAEMTAVRSFLDQFNSEYPSARVRIVGIQMPSVNGGLGANYGANGGYSEYFGMVRSANGLNMAYQNLANEAAYSGWVRFISTASQFDSENNMQQNAAVDVNSRNGTHETRGTNGVHPDTSGYLQIADAMFREFIDSINSFWR